MGNDFKLGDDVWARVVQIVQEGMILQIDIVDLLRQVRVEQDPGDLDTLKLTAGYRELVKKMHDQLLADAERLQNEQNDGALLDVDV